jgi:hypothetical protein
LIVIGQYNEGLVRPRWLTAHPVLQNADIIAVERLLRHQYDFDDPLEILYDFLDRFADHGAEASSLDEAGNRGSVAPDGH